MPEEKRDQPDHITTAHAIGEGTFLAALMDALPVPTAWTTLDGKIEYLNCTFITTFGYTLAEIPTLTAWAERAYPDPVYRQELLEAWLRESEIARRNNVHMASREVRVVCKDGSVLTMRVDGVVVYGRMLVTLTNITEYKRVEERLRKEQSFTDTIINSLPGPFYVVDLKGQLVRWNKFDVLKSLSDEQIRERSVLSFMHPDDRPRVIKALERAFSEGYGQAEARIVGPDGSTKEYLFTGKRMDTPEGSYVVGTGLDMTERRNAELSIRSARDYAQNLIETANAMVIGLDTNGNIIVFNKAAEEITGYTAAELKNRNWFEVLVPISQYPEVWDIFNKMQSGRLPKKFENPIRTKSGEERYIIWNNSEVHENGRLTGTVSFGIDITERRVLEEQLRQAQKMEAIGLLAGGIAHDFNNLLNIIIGYSDIVLRSLEPGTQTHQDLSEIKKASRQAAQLIAQLLAFSRKQRLEPSAVDLNNLINDMRQMLQRLIGEDIRLETRLAPAVSPVFIDQNQKEQIIMNLVANARDAMPEGGALTISTCNITLNETEASACVDAKPGNYVCLMVTDTGMGMDPETRERIFDPFFSTKKPGKGTGLGLSVIYGIVRQHGGWISVESEPGKGSTFRVFLPQFDSEYVGPVAENMAGVDLPRGAGERILVAEDNEDIRRVAVRVLSDHGYVVDAVANGSEARAALAIGHEAYALLFCDSVLPDCSGISLAEELQNIRPGLRILVTSGYFDEKAHGEKIRKNRYCYIQKPYDMRQLLVAVCDALADTEEKGGR